MDRNGYNKSILATTDGVCYICGKYCETARHEIYGGAGTRSLSKRYGLWVNICPECHARVHADPSWGKAAQLRDDARMAFLKDGHTPAEFTRIFEIGNIKWWEL